MTLHEVIKATLDDDYNSCIRRSFWSDGLYLNVLVDGTFTMYFKGEVVTENWQLTAIDVVAEDWQLYQSGEYEYADADDDFDISVYVMQPMKGKYVGAVMINTVEFDCPRDCIDALVSLSNEYELGYGVEDIDLGDVLGREND